MRRTRARPFIEHRVGPLRIDVDHLVAPAKLSGAGLHACTQFAGTHTTAPGRSADVSES
jgi:hypothetical protein